MQRNIMKERPLISVIVTAYNRTEYLKQAVDSVLAQTLSPDKYEVIVTKNFDTKYDEEWSKQGVILVLFEGMATGKRVINALRYCSGEVIAHLDDDDWWDPKKLQAVHEQWVKYPQTGYFYNERIDVDLNGQPLRRRLTKDWKQHGWNNSSVSIRRALIEENGAFLSHVLLAVDEFYHSVALLSDLPMVFASSLLTYFRIPPSGISKPARHETYLHDAQVIAHLPRISVNADRVRQFNEKVLQFLRWTAYSQLNKGRKCSVSVFVNYTSFAFRVRKPFFVTQWFPLLIAIFFPTLANHLQHLIRIFSRH
jgi:glycosyltransferase involved in cell wall biosynthesis